MIKLRGLGWTALFLTLIFGLSACWGTGSNAPVNAANGSDNSNAAAPAEPPFNTSEPDKYQAEIWQTKPDGTVKKFFVARDGDKWRVDMDHGSGAQVTTLHTDVMDVASAAEKTYCEYPSPAGGGGREDIVRSISHQMLNKHGKAHYQQLGSSGGVSIYNMILSDTEPGREAAITYDERLKLPVKKEIFLDVANGDRRPEMTIELKNFKTDVDPKLFAVPAGYKKVDVDDMRKTIQAATQD